MNDVIQQILQKWSWNDLYSIEIVNAVSFAL